MSQTWGNAQLRGRLVVGPKPGGGVNAALGSGGSSRPPGGRPIPAPTKPSDEWGDARYSPPRKV